MKMFNSKKGFTLIELLIVIAIIAVLAVAFLPTILGAPAKGRDTARIASLQKIQKVLIAGDLVGTPYPSFPAGTCIDSTTFSNYLTSLGGAIPNDPSNRSGTTDFAASTLTPKGCAGTAPGKFFYKSAPSTSYKFGLYAVMENCSAANAQCGLAAGGTITAPTCSGGAATAASNLCYAILMQ
ncbi:MAG: type II secretion system protein [Pedobacter sp.]|jgi:prepilin-type N-terminal cleavage/methylation domain-containing protein|uniref:type II secretion system protein n=1 Tax=Pedobacter sp. TaxID=1411316 RepID=UPI003568511D